MRTRELKTKTHIETTSNIYIQNCIDINSMRQRVKEAKRDEKRKKNPIHSVLFVLLLFHLLYLFKIHCCCRLAGIEFFIFWLHIVRARILSFVPFLFIPFHAPFHFIVLSLSLSLWRIVWACVRLWTSVHCVYSAHIVYIECWNAILAHRANTRREGETKSKWSLRWENKEEIYDNMCTIFDTIRYDTS